MSNEEFTHRSNLSRRRRENTPPGAQKRRDLWVTIEEEAEREKVTVPNLLISSALSEHSPTERRGIATELMSLHNLLLLSPTTSTSSHGRQTPRVSSQLKRAKH
jgi:hypothetical protein